MWIGRRRWTRYTLTVRSHGRRETLPMVASSHPRSHAPAFVRVLVATGVLLGALGCGERTATRSPLTLAFVGDMMLGRRVEETMRARGDWSYPFRPLAHRLRNADLSFGNLECVVARGGTARGGLTFRADPATLTGLVDAGFDVVSVANNHTPDFGAEGLTEMLAHLDAARIAYTGVAHGELQNPLVLTVRGTRVGYLAFSYTAGPPGGEAAAPRIAKITGRHLVRSIVAARPAADYLVVSLHLGKQFEPRATAMQRGIAQGAIEAGADLVVGHHPHVPQEIEKYRQGIIAYSLGDFVFDHPDASVDGALLEITLDGARPTTIVYARTRINQLFQPELVAERRWEGTALEGPDGVLD